jgi:hypothetical protein
MPPLRWNPPATSTQVCAREDRGILIAETDTSGSYARLEKITAYDNRRPRIGDRDSVFIWNRDPAD